MLPGPESRGSTGTHYVIRAPRRPLRASYTPRKPQGATQGVSRRYNPIERLHDTRSVTDNLNPRQFSPTQAADRRSRRRNLGPAGLGQSTRGLSEQLPELVEAARILPNSGMAKDRQKFESRVGRGEALPQDPREHAAYNRLSILLTAALGRRPTRDDFKAHFGVDTHAEVRQAIRRHIGLDD